VWAPEASVGVMGVVTSTIAHVTLPFTELTPEGNNPWGLPTKLGDPPKL
jgi:hypothetical protein